MNIGMQTVSFYNDTVFGLFIYVIYILNIHFTFDRQMNYIIVKMEMK